MSPPSLVRSTLVIMAGYGASKAVGILRDPLIARGFGAGPQLDAYYAAFTIPDLLFTLIAGGALATAFIPVFTEALTLRGKSEAWRIASGVINLVVLTTAGLAVLVALFAPALVSCCLAPGFAEPEQALTVELMRLILISTVIFALAGVLMGILNAQQHFFSPAFAPALYNIGIIAGTVFLAPHFGIHGVAYGVVGGALLHLASHFPPLFRHGIAYRPRLMLRDPAIHEILRLMGPRIAALGVIKVNTLVATNLASRLDEGSVSALNLAWNMMQIPETIIATAIATALFPTLSRFAAEGRRTELRAAMGTAIRSILLLCLPALVGLLALGRPATYLLYSVGGGRCAAGCVDAIVWALQFYALALMGHSLLEVAARTFYAQKDTLTPLVAAVVAMALNAILAYILIAPLAHGGIAFANAVAVSCEVAILLAVAQRRLPGIEGDKLLRAALKGGVAAALMAAILVLWERAGMTAPITALAGGVAAAGGYFLAAWFLRVDELQLLLRRFRRASTPTG